MRRPRRRGPHAQDAVGVAPRDITLSRRLRGLPQVEAELLSVQWGWRCAVFGCDRGPATGHALVPHHGSLFSQTGTTSLGDTVPLCEQDHHHLHRGRRSLRLRDGRETGPDGRVDVELRSA